MSVITLERQVLKKNNEVAEENRNYFAENNTFVLNLVSSAGSGKTSLLERTIDAMKRKVALAVIEGDVQTDNDAQRIAAHDVPVAQLITNGLCHLEANLVQTALDRLPKQLDLCIIENVGNLVCPASYDLGEHYKVVAVSVTEGDDKPLKYPAMFRQSQVLIVNKIDLLPYVQFDVDACIRNAHQINPALKVFRTSATTGEGIDEWCAWIQEGVAAVKNANAKIGSLPSQQQ